ncbi:heavy metal-binding domain-containing protein [Mangrovibacterium lignilyticum]|uniref:heavy metal-binding domain-containing protein n=1 Tax=Mangrovibacterium lignilyticum TaxID=2668052 RepID=UPI0013D3CB85|nr:heavy metal-binding domain-containing protein [Mangrovibacterium lignilyticum]
MKTLREIFKRFGPSNELRESAPCCGGGGSAHRHHQAEQGGHAKMLYQCPMKCEGDKTYDEPGNCPICNMHLTPVKN